MRKSAVWILPVLLLMTAAPHARSAAKDEPPGKKAQVTIKNRKYSPATVKVLKGGTITWVNQDQHEHTVAEEDGVFKSDEIKPGKSYKFTFDKVGRYKYACKLHPRMKGIVEVVN